MSADADRIAMCRHDNLPHLCRVCLNDRIVQLTAELAEARQRAFERDTYYAGWEGRMADLTSERDAAQAELAESYAIARMREIEILAERDAAQAGVAAMRGALREIERETYTEDGLSYRHIHNLAQRGLCAGDSGRALAARVPLWRALERLVRGGCTPLNERVGKLLFDLAALDEKGGNE